jgi:hypothetical protein
MRAPLDEVDFGWWLLGMAPLWRLSWCAADGWLRLYRAGGREFVLRLAKFPDRMALESALNGWPEAFGDGAWLAGRFPAIAPFTRTAVSA